MKDCSSDAARAGLVARPEQVRAEGSQRVGIIGIERGRLPRQRHRFIEPIVVRRELPCQAVHLAVVRRDGERLRDFRLVLGLLVFDVGHGGQQRVRVEARRIDGERLLQELPPFVAFVGVGGLACQEHIRVDRRRVDVERLLRQRHRLRRIVVGQRLRGAEERRRPARVRLEDRLERFQRFAVLFGLQGIAHPTPVLMAGSAGARFAAS